jgi:hypothetical protein
MRRLWNAFLDSTWGLPLALFGGVALLSVLVVVAEANRETYSAPVEACEVVRTGGTRTTVHMQCVTVGNNACGSQIPITQVLEEREYSCKWKDWK